MANSPVLTATKDNAKGQLNSGINASSLTIPLKSGQGALFPQPYNGSATSGGTSSTLNCTGISALIGGSAAVGKPIRNVTDGSWAFIRSVSTNSITTDALQNGSDNTWQNADKWRIDEFVITIETHDTAVPYNVTASEKVIVYGRSTDNLLVESTSDRGADGSTAQSWLADSYVYLHVTSYTVRKIIEQLSELGRLNDANITSLGLANTNIANMQSGSYWYVATSGSANAYVAATPAFAAYAAGQRIVFKANFTNTGSATINVNGLGAVTIKKQGGATNLASGDIQNGQIVVIVYDGTNFQMASPIGQSTSSAYHKEFLLGYTSATALSNPTSHTQFGTPHVYTITANDLINGVAYRFRIGGAFTWAAGSLEFRTRLGTTTVCGDPNVGTPSGAGSWQITGEIWGTAAAGGSVNVRCLMQVTVSSPTNGQFTQYQETAVATNGSLDLNWTGRMPTSNAGNTITAHVSDVEKVSTSAFS